MPDSTIRWPRAVRALRAGLAAAVASRAAVAQPPAAHVRDVQVTIDTVHPVRRFVPRDVFGAGIDGRPAEDARATFDPRNVAAMRSAGLPRLSYRLRTELGIEAWHWTNRGRWSDAANSRGYWLGDDRPAPDGAPLPLGYGYRLPRRGTTIDQGDNDGYSRLTDGDAATFWKSNPYLSARYTGEPDALHPQRVVVDLGAAHPVNAVRIAWGAPWAARYTVEYWDGNNAESLEGPSPVGHWRAFSGGAVTDGRGGIALTRVEPGARPARWIRVTMTESSHTAPANAVDPRDSLGYAIREIGVGTIGAGGNFVDAVRHAPSHAQSATWASSTDPWHRATDRDPELAQPSVERAFTSGLAAAGPPMLSVGVLYDTPENGAALVRYLRARGLRAARAELGEEPDGQDAPAADYGALAVQVADALHAADPALVTGGPSLQTVLVDFHLVPAEPTSRPWITAMREYLVARGRARDFGFFSFEWYPFDSVCAPTGPYLRQQPAMLTSTVERFARGGLAHDVPWIATEFGYSAFASPAEVQLAGALFVADFVGAFLTAGGDEAYLYGYEPTELQREPECPLWGNNALFLGDGAAVVRDTTAAYWATRLLTQAWTDPAGGAHTLFRANTNWRDSAGDAVVSAYPLRQPGGTWAVLLVNKDSLTTVRPHLHVPNATDLAGGIAAAIPRAALGRWDVWQLSAAEYAWRGRGRAGRPVWRGYPTARRVAADSLLLPGYSVTVVRLRP